MKAVSFSLKIEFLSNFHSKDKNRGRETATRRGGGAKPLPKNQVCVKKYESKEMQQHLREAQIFLIENRGGGA